MDINNENDFSSAMNERTNLLLGEDSVDKLSNANVLIVGVGGVGGWVCELLIRSGIRRLTIVDGDNVAWSNLNRQLVATAQMIGHPKVDLMKERLLQINPHAQVIAKNIFLKDELTPQLLDEVNPTIVIDAIDSLSPKVHLIRETVERGIPIVSSMGAGAKSNPATIEVADLSKSYNCTLAKAVRKRLKNYGIKKGVKVIFSTELPDKNAVIEVEGENCKRSTAGTISYMPALFGCRIAAEVINILTK